MKRLIYCFVFFVSFSMLLHSGGFQINDHSARSISMGFSTIANINDPSALFYNPSAIVNIQSDLALSIGASYIMPGSKFTGITTLNQQNTTALETWNFLVPNGYLTWKTPINGLYFGLGVFVPFGLGTRWPTPWVGSYSAQETYLNNIEINPNLAFTFELLEMPVSVSAGFGYVMGNVELKKFLDVFYPAPFLKLKGDGTATTFNFGFFIQPFHSVKIGASYRHNIEMEYKGDVSYDYIQGAEPLFQATTGSAKIKYPNDLRIGVAYNLLKDLWLEFGINYVGWSSYDTLAIHFEKGPGNPSAPYTSSQPRLYKNVITYRLSAEYFLTSSIALRCGIFYDPMPVDPDYVEPVLPEGNRFSGAIGLGWKLFKNLSFDIGYMGIIAQQTEVKNNPNLFNGIYNCWANILALSINLNY